MKRLNFPAFDRAVVRELRTKVDDIETAQKHWKRGYGKYKAFKEQVTDAMKAEQSDRCAYCGTRLHEKRPHRDHIAPKSPHFQWTFWPINLVLACYCCNVDCKGEIDTVAVVSKSYRRTVFTIVHPFLDDPAEHLDFEIAEKSILVKPRHGSAKGANTISLFNLMDPERAKERAKDLLLDDDIEHLQGVNREMMLAAMKDLGGTRIVMKPNH